jgi:vesicle-fusing ATPase
MTIEVDFVTKKASSLDPYDTDRLSADLVQQFSNQAFTVGQTFVFQPRDQTKKMLICTVKSLEAADLNATIQGSESKHRKLNSGQLLPNSGIIFEKPEGSALNLIGKSKG